MERRIRVLLLGQRCTGIVGATGLRELLARREAQSICRYRQDSERRQQLAETASRPGCRRASRYLCSVALAVALLAGCASRGPEDISIPQSEREAAQIIEPEVERREIKTPKIDRENWEIGAYAGIMSIEDFGTNPVYGVRAAYHIAEDLFVEAAVGRTEAGLSSIEELANVRVTENRDFTYYNISFGYNFLPGEIFLGKDYALNSQLYVIGGVGATRFAKEDNFTVNFGAGVRVLATDWIAVHFDVRDHIFATDLLGSNEATNNLEAHLGFTVYF